MARKVPGKVVVVVIMLTIGFVAYGGYQDRHAAIKPESWGRVGCTEALKAQLAAPTTAKIEWLGYGANPNKDLHYEFTITGKVTAQNAFSAMLTKDFICYHNGKQDFRGQVVIAP